MERLPAPEDLRVPEGSVRDAALAPLAEARVIEHLRTDLIPWEIGPYHAGLPGPMRLRLSLDGEIIVSGSVETGFLHRGLEKAIELHPWSSSVAYSDHLDPDGSVFGELALCLGVEQISGVAVPPRAQGIRIVLTLPICSRRYSKILWSFMATGAMPMIRRSSRDSLKLMALKFLSSVNRKGAIQISGATGTSVCPNLRDTERPSA
jgi:hypothetical protein